MKVTTETIEKSQVVLNIEVDPEEMERAVQQAYRRVGARTTIPGFRKGKAPVAMLERYLGKEALVEEAAEHLLPEVYERVIREHEVPIIAQPQVEVIKVDPLAFKATVPVRPTIELGDYRTIKLESKPVEVADQEVSATLEKLRSAQAPWEPVDRPAGTGDLLAIDVEGTIDGEKVIEEKDGWFPLAPDARAGVPGFAEKLEGAVRDEVREFTLTLPEERSQYGGKECSFRVTVKEVKEKRLPELDDELAKSLGLGLETLDALKERIAGDIRVQKEREARSLLEEKAVSALIDTARLEYPDVLVEHEIEHLMEEQQRYFGQGQKLENYLEALKKTEEELKNELRPVAERLVTRSLVLHKFAELEGVEVEASEIDSEIQRMLEHTEEDRLRSALQTEQARESLRRSLYMKKALDRLVELTTATDEEAGSGEVEASSQSEEVVENENRTE
ncbi:MAG: trigger factor [Dehalococcoidia bacterium]|nr:trigger factor [Dehalococcoidia bacterium]